MPRLSLTSETGEQVPMYGTGVFQFPCPRCGRDRARTAPAIWQDFRTEIEAADLPPDVLESLLEALPNMPEGTTPDSLKERFPQARAVIDLAVKLDPVGWIAVLTLIVTIISTALNIGTFVATEDAARTAHADAQEALRVAREAQAEQPSKLSDQDIAKIITQVEAHMHAQSRQQQAGGQEREQK